VPPLLLLLREGSRLAEDVQAPLSPEAEAATLQPLMRGHDGLRTLPLRSGETCGKLQDFARRVTRKFQNEGLLAWL